MNNLKVKFIIYVPLIQNYQQSTLHHHSFSN